MWSTSHHSLGFLCTTKISKVLVVHHVSEPGWKQWTLRWQLLSGGEDCYLDVLVIMVSVDMVIVDD